MNNPVSMQRVFHHFLADYQHQHHLSPAQHKVCRHIRVCRTEALGGQKVECEHCGFEQIRYHSCRDRHCPKCQHAASQQWFQHPETVVQYLIRYTHKVAISDSRLVSVDDEQVRFNYQDYRDGQHKRMSLTPEEFIRWFLLHVLPPGFMRVRHFGFLSNRVRQQKLARIRNCLNTPRQEDSDQPMKLEPSVPVGYVCPKCRIGRLCVIGETAPQRFEGW